MNDRDADVLVIGAGPAGSSVAIRLARAGWRVAILEQSAYPRHKVCGECLSSASLRRLHELDVGDRLRSLAGPEIRRVAWMSREGAVSAEMPACVRGPYRYGRAMGRDLLDALLLERARELNVRIIQPAQARRLHGAPGAFVCAYRSRSAGGRTQSQADETICASIVIDAHGSWERAPAGDAELDPRPLAPSRQTDLLGFKATFFDTALPAGLLPVLSLPGGYGGMVVSDRGRTTVACCIRRDVLLECRTRVPGGSAGAAVEAFLRSSCRSVAAALEGARLEGGWQSIGPLRPGFHARSTTRVFQVGNAAAEAHPLIGEGICMALESAALLAALLGTRPAHVDERHTRRVQEVYVRAARAAFARRMHLAQLYSHLAMRERIGTAITSLMRQYPRTLTLAARLAGKARGGNGCSRTATQTNSAGTDDAFDESGRRDNRSISDTP